MWRHDGYLTFLRIYELLLPSSFSTSFTRSRLISSDEMLANVHSASPTAYMLEWFMSLQVSVRLSPPQ
jgi:hypothetical protein